MSQSGQQPISAIRVTEADDTFLYEVGKNGITLIQPYEEAGQYCMIPYVRVWRGHEKIVEYCKHDLAAVFYGPPEESGE